MSGAEIPIPSAGAAGYVSKRDFDFRGRSRVAHLGRRFWFYGWPLLREFRRGGGFDFFLLALRLRGLGRRRSSRFPVLSRKQSCSRPTPRSIHPYIADASGLVEVVHFFSLGHALGAVEALAALAAAIGAVGEKEENPEFQEASALGAMHVFAAAERAIAFFGIDEQAQSASHRKRMIATLVAGSKQRSCYHESGKFPALQRGQRAQRMMPQLAQAAIHGVLARQKAQHGRAADG